MQMKMWDKNDLGRSHGWWQRQEDWSPIGNRVTSLMHRSCTKLFHLLTSWPMMILIYSVVLLSGLCNHKGECLQCDCSYSMTSVMSATLLEATGYLDSMRLPTQPSLSTSRCHSTGLASLRSLLSSISL